jgi:hypothetical protein
VALNFPSSPTIGQVYTDATSGFSYEWDGTVWKSYTPSSSSQIKILDDISGSFNGSTQSFPITSSGAPITPPSSASLIINLGGVIQDPSDDYGVSGSNIVFSSAPINSLSFSGISLGPAVPVTVVTIPDGTVTDGSLTVSGNLSSIGGFNIGIQSASTNVTTGVITALNFVGAGNTFLYNAGTKTVDISIAGGGGAGVSSTGILTCRGIANAEDITESIAFDDFFGGGTNYGMIGPITVSGAGTTVTVGAGVSYVII